MLLIVRAENNKWCSGGKIQEWSVSVHLTFAPKSMHTWRAGGLDPAGAHFPIDLTLPIPMNSVSFFGEM